MTSVRSTTELPVLRAGIYRHYKDHLYLVLGYARDSNDKDRTVVVYIGLDLEGAQSGERMMVRSVDDFYAMVNPETGEAFETWDGAEPYPVKRFAYVGPTVDLG